MQNLSQGYLKSLLTLWLLPLILLSACASKLVFTQANAPAQAMVKCDALRNPNADESSESYINYLIDTYYVCALRDDALRVFLTPAKS